MTDTQRIPDETAQRAHSPQLAARVSERTTNIFTSRQRCGSIQLKIPRSLLRGSLQSPIISMLRKYGDDLFTLCPSNEDLVRYAGDPALLSKEAAETIQKHLSVCLDCRDKVALLTDPGGACCSACDAIL